MNENQRKFLTEYLGEKWQGDIEDSICQECGTVFSISRTFTEPKDKHDLLEAIIKKGERFVFCDGLADVEGKYKPSASASDDVIRYSILTPYDFMKYLLLLSPIETAELICKWKGVEK